MTAADRRERIARLARTEGPTSVGELAARFDVTASTIRRDLVRLTSEGAIARTFGGAIPPTPSPETGLRQRIGQAYEQKRAIAHWAANQVDPGSHLLLDSGSTVSALAHELSLCNGLTVTTTGLTALNELAEADGVTVRCLGGTLRPKSQGFVGPLTDAAVERMTFDIAFLGADGVSPTLGLCEAEVDQTRLKELIAARTRRVFVLAHSAKLNDPPFHSWATLKSPWTLVTDSGITDDQQAAFSAAGVEVVAVAVT